MENQPTAVEENEKSFSSLEVLSKYLKDTFLAAGLFLVSFGAAEAQSGNYPEYSFKEKTEISVEQAGSIEEKIHEADSLANVLIARESDTISRSQHGLNLAYMSKNTNSGEGRCIVYEFKNTFNTGGKEIEFDSKTIYTDDERYTTSNNPNNPTGAKDWVIMEEYNGPVPAESCISPEIKKIMYKGALVPKDPSFKMNAPVAPRILANQYTPDDLASGLDNLITTLKQEIEK